MTPLTPDALAIVRELRGVVDVRARLRFCIALLGAQDHASPLDTRIEVVRAVLLYLVAELAAAEHRTATPQVVRVLDQLAQISALANEGRPFVRGGRLARIAQLSREARRVLRSA